MAPGMAALVRLSRPNIPRSFKAAGDSIRPGPIRPSINTLAGATIGVASAGCRCPAIFPVIRNVYTRDVVFRYRCGCCILAAAGLFTVRSLPRGKAHRGSDRKIENCVSVMNLRA